MNLYKLMEARKSIRDFSAKKVSEETLIKILKAGFSSPSGANQKPFTHIIIQDKELKEKIRKNCENTDKKYFQQSQEWFKKWMENKKISLDKYFLTDAPYIVIICGETDKPYWLESTWISIGYIILAVTNEGLGTLTYTPADFEYIKKEFSLPENTEPVVILPIGYPK